MLATSPAEVLTMWDTTAGALDNKRHNSLPYFGVCALQAWHRGLKSGIGSTVTWLWSELAHSARQVK